MGDLYECLTAELNKPYSVIHDLTLIGSDGVHVPASRALLSVRSKHLQELFYRHQRSTAYTFSFPSPVLRAFVWFCYTDSVIPSVQTPRKFTDEAAVSLVQLQIAGEQLGITKLHEDVWSILKTQLRAHSGGICAVMEELMNRGCLNNVERNIPANKYRALWELCFNLMDEKPESLLPGDRCNLGIRWRSFRLLETIFQGMGKLLDPMTAVKVLKEWNRFSGQMVTGDERTKLQMLADGINLECLSYTDITRLEPCDLFSSERLYVASVHVWGDKIMPEVSREQRRAFQARNDERNLKAAPSVARTNEKVLNDIIAGALATARRSSVRNNSTERTTNSGGHNPAAASPGPTKDKKEKQKAPKNAISSLSPDAWFQQHALKRLEASLNPKRVEKRKDTSNNLVDSPTKRKSKKTKAQTKPNVLAQKATVAEIEAAAIAKKGQGELEYLNFNGKVYYRYRNHYPRIECNDSELVLSLGSKPSVEIHRINLADIKYYAHHGERKYARIFMKDDDDDDDMIVLRFVDWKEMSGFFEVICQHVPTRKHDGPILLF